MAMRQKGYVVQATPREIHVRVVRESSCGGHCASCKGCPAGTVTVTCPNTPDNPFQTGDMVELIMPMGKFFQTAFWSYGFPALLMLAGAMLGYGISGRDGGSVLGAFVGLVLGVAAVRWIFHKRNSGIRAVPISGSGQE